jgi:hypothetical protein
MPNLKIFYHIIDLNLNHTKLIFEEQLTKMKVSGLLDVAELNINYHYNENSFDDLKEQYSNINWIFKPSSPVDAEITTNRLMKDTADNTAEEFYALYTHQKGVSYVEGLSYRATPSKHWRWIMDYWTIERWRDCIAKLDEGYDAVGSLLRDNHFSGNVYWLKSSFIRKCNKLPLPSSSDYINPWPDVTPVNGPEMWAGRNGAKFYNMYDTGNHDHYMNPHPPEIYRK